jgi:hypothetical protein
MTLGYLTKGWTCTSHASALIPCFLLQSIIASVQRGSVVVSGMSAADIPRVREAFTAHWLKPRPPIRYPAPIHYPADLVSAQTFLFCATVAAREHVMGGQRGLMCTYGSPT